MNCNEPSKVSSFSAEPAGIFVPKPGGAYEGGGEKVKEEKDEDNGRDEQSEEEEEEPIRTSITLPPDYSVSSETIRSQSDAVDLKLLLKVPEENPGDATAHSVHDSSDEGRSKGTVISASCVGLTGFLFLLYKFTPLRSILDPRIRNTKKNLMNEVQRSNELQSLDYNFDPTTMDVNRYNIGY